MKAEEIEAKLREGLQGPANIYRCKIVRKDDENSKRLDYIGPCFSIPKEYLWVKSKLVRKNGVKV